LSSTTDFIAELVRAANEVEKLIEFERHRLLERAVATIRDMRETIGIPSAQVQADKIIDLQVMVAAIGAEAKTSQEVRAAILASAAMIRDLHIVLDTRTEIQIEQK
jgi:hypothetical protein